MLCRRYCLSPFWHGIRKTQGIWTFLQNSGKLREFQSDIFLNLLIIFSWTMICDACLCSGKFNVLTVFLPTFSWADINDIFTVIMRASHHGTLQLGHVGWVKVSRLAVKTYLNSVSISGKNSGKTQGIWNGFPVGTLIWGISTFYICIYVLSHQHIGHCVLKEKA